MNTDKPTNVDPEKPASMEINKYTLFKECVSEKPLETRLALIRAALDVGFSPNEVDRRPRSEGRPLHYAICDSCLCPPYVLKQNLPIVQLLLEAGADPRLPGWKPVDESPIVDLKNWLTNYETEGERWPKEDQELKPFFEQAYAAMKKVADELDGKSCIANMLCI
jgi:hypothetical protein